MKNTVHIIGAGLAGTEAAYFLANRGIFVKLYEMRPHLMTEAHQTKNFAELVCSNTFKSKDPFTPTGRLKIEMESLGSLHLQTAKKAEIPSGQALGVDREIFSTQTTEVISSHPRIEVLREEVALPPENEWTIVATGPLTSEKLASWIQSQSSSQDLYFYDAIAPILDAESIDRSIVFESNRYGKGGESAYLNCPFSKEEYENFIEALTLAEKVAPKSFEVEKFFQGCQPIEAIAQGGKDSLRFGPMKPVGLTDPNTDKRPYAVVQLRPENESKSAYNMVGFQTKLKYPEQQRVFRMIPGLSQAEFLRLGSIHRNTYIDSPRMLSSDLSLKSNPKLFFAGQITGVEGYMDSSASGILSALFLYQKMMDYPFSPPPKKSMLGALYQHLRTPSDNYQPSNIHFGLFDLSDFHSIPPKKKDEKRKQIILQCEEAFREWKASIDSILHSTENL